MSCKPLICVLVILLSLFLYKCIGMMFLNKKFEMYADLQTISKQQEELEKKKAQRYQAFLDEQVKAQKEAFKKATIGFVPKHSCLSPTA